VCACDKNIEDGIEGNKNKRNGENIKRQFIDIDLSRKCVHE